MSLTANSPVIIKGNEFIMPHAAKPSLAGRPKPAPAPAAKLAKK
jgi:hypothetical protein